MIIIGLTGGIASGKSTAARQLQARGVHRVDADSLAHRVYEPGTEAYALVVDAFGQGVVAADGRIDRAALGQCVFGRPDKLEQLTAIVWPATRALVQREVDAIAAEDPTAVVVIEAPLLLEAGWQDLVDEVWVVVVERATAVERAVARGGLTAEQVEARIDAQLSNDERKAHADVVIDNSGSEEQLERRIEILRAGLEKPAAS